MALFSGSPMYYAQGASVTLPTVTVTAPAANPCTPTANVTIDYGYTGTGGTAVCIITITAWGTNGVGTLMYKGPPASPGTNPYPTSQFTIVSSTDSGTVGQLVIAPAAGVYWPTTVCTWTAVITTDVFADATSTATQNVNAALIPGVPTCTLTVPASNPCAPNANITVAYTIPTGTAGMTLTVSAYGSGGEGALIFAGNPITNLPAAGCPVGDFNIVSQTDNGTAGSIVLAPDSGIFWPITTCTWQAVVTSATNVTARSTGSQVINTALIPMPSISAQTPAPGSVISPDQAVEFDILDAILTVVYVQFSGNIIKEVVYNNSVFSGGYLAGSTRTAITGGYHYYIKRQPGWPGNPTFTATAADADGNVI